MKEPRFSPFVDCSPYNFNHKLYEFEELVGKHRYIEICPKLIEEIPGEFVEKFDSYDHCKHPFPVYRTKKEITLIAKYSLGGRMFTPNSLQIVLPTGSKICLIPIYHTFNRTDSCACLTVKVNE